MIHNQVQIIVNALKAIEQLTETIDFKTNKKLKFQTALQNYVKQVSEKNNTLFKAVDTLNASAIFNLESDEQPAKKEYVESSQQTEVEITTKPLLAIEMSQQPLVEITTKPLLAIEYFGPLQSLSPLWLFRPFDSILYIKPIVEITKVQTIFSLVENATIEISCETMVKISTIESSCEYEVEITTNESEEETLDNTIIVESEQKLQIQQQVDFIARMQQQIDLMGDDSQYDLIKQQLLDMMRKCQELLDQLQSKYEQNAFDSESVSDLYDESQSNDSVSVYSDFEVTAEQMVRYQVDSDQLTEQYKSRKLEMFAQYEINQDFNELKINYKLLLLDIHPDKSDKYHELAQELITQYTKVRKQLKQQQEVIVPILAIKNCSYFDDQMILICKASKLFKFQSLYFRVDIIINRWIQILIKQVNKQTQEDFIRLVLKSTYSQTDIQALQTAFDQLYKEYSDIVVRQNSCIQRQYGFYSDTLEEQLYARGELITVQKFKCSSEKIKNMIKVLKQ